MELRPPKSREDRIRLNPEINQYELFCNKCETFKPCDSFYTRHKNLSPTRRSRWDSICVICANIVRKSRENNIKNGVNPTLFKKERSRMNPATAQYELLCNRCGIFKSCDNFYVKYKNMTPSQRSHWSALCINCVKTYRKDHYSRNKHKIHKRFNDRYRTDPFFKQRQIDKRNERKLRKSKNPEKLLCRRRVHSMDPGARYLWDKIRAIKQRAKKAGLAFNITFEDLQELYKKQSGKCYYTDTPLILGPNDMFSASVDRKDSNEGYTKENIVLCGTIINLMKLDSSLKEFYDLTLLLSTSLKKKFPYLD